MNNDDVILDFDTSQEMAKYGISFEGIDRSVVSKNDVSDDLRELIALHSNEETVDAPDPQSYVRKLNELDQSVRELLKSRLTGDNLEDKVSSVWSEAKHSAAKKIKRAGRSYSNSIPVHWISGGIGDVEPSSFGVLGVELVPVRAMLQSLHDVLSGKKPEPSDVFVGAMLRAINSSPYMQNSMM